MKSNKKHMLGLETEFILIDNNGFVVHNADSIMKPLKKGTAKKEAAHNMIEVISNPFEIITDSAHELLDKIIAVNESAEKHDARLFYYSTYPGKFNPSIRKDKPYFVKEKIFGKERFKIAGRCVGFHFHYTLPKGIFDNISKKIKIMVKSNINKNMIDSYNMMIAMDPALTTFLQSSPYYQGQYYGKDSRMMFYRGNRFFGVEGLYTRHQDFGALPQYYHTIFDISHLVDERFRKWSLMMKKLEMNIKSISLYGSILDTNWGPIKINPHGTLEIRGMDMNKFYLISSSAVIIKFMLKAIQEDVINIEINQLAIKDPLKMEGDVVYIPPFTYVDLILQRDSAIYGMESKEIRNYCSNLLNLSRKIIPKDRRKFLQPFRKMISSKRTVSDEILKEAGKLGAGDTITGKQAAELSLKITDNINKEIKKAERFVRLS